MNGRAVVGKTPATGVYNNLQSVIISTPHALQAYDDRIGHHRPAMRAESL